jgi:hypothetical protein
MPCSSRNVPETKTYSRFFTIVAFAFVVIYDNFADIIWLSCSVLRKVAKQKFAKQKILLS